MNGRGPCGQMMLYRLCIGYPESSQGLESTSLATKETDPPFYTKNWLFHLIQSRPVALQKNIKIPQSLWTCLDIIIYMWQALLANTHSAIPGTMMVAKRYLNFCMSVPYKRYIATTPNDNLKPSTPMGEWENSHNFYLESFNNYLHYSLVSLNLYSFGIGYECPKSAIFGVKWGVSFFCRQDRTLPLGRRTWSLIFLPRN